MGVVLMTGMWTTALGALLALVLHALEQALPVRPAWIWAEVVAGVLVVAIPVSVLRRVAGVSDAGVYELMVVAGFVGAGIPIVGWQLWLYRPGK